MPVRASQASQMCLMLKHCCPGASCSRAAPPVETVPGQGEPVGCPPPPPNSRATMRILRSFFVLCLCSSSSSHCALLPRHGLLIVLTNTRCCCHCTPPTILFFTPPALTLRFLARDHSHILSNHLPGCFNFSGIFPSLGLGLRPLSVCYILVVRHSSAANRRARDSFLQRSDLLTRHPLLFNHLNFHTLLPQRLPLLRWRTSKPCTSPWLPHTLKLEANGMSGRNGQTMKHPLPEQTTSPPHWRYQAFSLRQEHRAPRHSGRPNRDSRP